MQIKQQYLRLGFNTREQWEFPNIVNLCVLRGKCPCKCEHCPVGITPVSDRIKRFGDKVVSLELYKKIAEEMSHYPHATLRIHAIGEPLLWKDLVTALEISKEYNIRTWLFTCLVIQNVSLIENILINCDIIEVSINSRSREDYIKTKGIDAFELVNENISILISKKKRHNLKTKILASRVESNNPHEDDAFVKHWKQVGIDDAFVRTFHNYNNAIKNLLNKGCKDIIPCLVHWSRFNVDCDGKAVICFNELFKYPQASSNVIIGDVNKNFIHDIWQKSERLNKIRLAQLKKDYSIIDFTDYIPCEECISCQPIDGDKPTSEIQIVLGERRNGNQI